jgi:hypothetical protein
MNESTVALLFSYGPFALLTFFVFVTLRISAKKLKEHPESNLHKRIYIANWVGIFVLAVIITIIWTVLHVKQRAVLRGAIQNLPSGFAVSNDLSQEGVDLYTLKRYGDRNAGIVRYEWAAFSDHRLDDGQMISIVVSDPDSAEAIDRELQLKVQSSYYDSPPIIRYHKREDKFTLEENGIETD